MTVLRWFVFLLFAAVSLFFIALGMLEPSATNAAAHRPGVQESSPLQEFSLLFSRSR